MKTIVSDTLEIKWSELKEVEIDLKKISFIHTAHCNELGTKQKHMI